MGPKHSMILASVCYVLETYHNIKMLFNLLEVEKLNFKLSTNLKLVNIIIGKQSAACKFPCPYGNWIRNENYGWSKGEKLFFNDLKTNHRNYVDHACEKLQKLINYKNKEFDPLINGNSVISYEIPPPVRVIKNFFYCLILLPIF